MHKLTISGVAVWLGNIDKGYAVRAGGPARAAKQWTCTQPPDRQHQAGGE